MEAAKGERLSFNALSDPTPPDLDATPIPINVKIETGLLNFKMEISISETRHSHTVFMKPEWRKPNYPRVYYVYEQREIGRVEVSDHRLHIGAAYLDYNQKEDTLSGTYWTERQSDRGINTAGSIQLRRVKSHNSRTKNL